MFSHEASVENIDRTCFDKLQIILKRKVTEIKKKAGEEKKEQGVWDWGGELVACFLSFMKFMTFYYRFQMSWEIENRFFER